MKKLLCALLSALMLLTFPAAVLASSPAPGSEWTYDEWYSDVHSHAVNIEKNYAELKKLDAKYKNASYESYAEYIGMIAKGKLTVSGYVVDIAAPEALKLSVGSLELTVMSEEKVRDAVLSALKLANGLLEPLDDTLSFDLLDRKPVTSELLSERAALYGGRLSDALSELDAFARENDLSGLVTKENVAALLTAVWSEEAPDLSATAFDMLSDELGSEKAIEAGLILSRILDLSKRMDKLKEDAIAYAGTSGAADVSAAAQAFSDAVTDALVKLLSSPLLGK